MVKSNQAIATVFPISNPATGAAIDADSLPTGLLYVNGVVNAAVVILVHIATGWYSASVALPILSAGDMVALRVSATVNSIAGEGKVWEDVADTVYVSEVPADTDTILTANHGTGSWQRVTGSSPNTVTYILEAEGNPVSGGQVWVYTDPACTNLVAYGITDIFGQIVFYLSAGTYYVKRAKDTSILFTPTVITMVVT